MPRIAHGTEIAAASDRLLHAVSRGCQTNAARGRRSQTVGKEFQRNARYR